LHLPSVTAEHNGKISTAAKVESEEQISMLQISICICAKEAQSAAETQQRKL
jgi:hypothetical protein